MELIKRE